MLVRECILGMYEQVMFEFLWEQICYLKILHYEKFLLNFAAKQGTRRNTRDSLSRSRGARYSQRAILWNTSPLVIINDSTSFLLLKKYICAIISSTIQKLFEASELTFITVTCININAQLLKF